MKTGIIAASCLVASLVSAHAGPAVIATGGQWSALADTVSAVKLCSVQAQVNGGRLSLSGASDTGGVLRLSLYKQTWNIPNINVPMQLTFPDNVTFSFLGVGSGSIIRADIPVQDVKPFLHHLTADAVVKLTLPEGHELPWQLDLTGTTPTVNAMALCLATAQIWLPPPFPQQPAPSVTSGAQATPSTSYSAAPAPPPESSQNREPSQNQEAIFLGLIQTHLVMFQNAPNDLLKGAVRQERRTALCSVLPSLAVENWVGTIDGLSSSSAGLGVLSVKISDNVTLATWNNSLSDFGDHTLIPAEASYFSRLAAMSVGTKVIFSGDFIPGDSDCVREKSFTQEGAMADPEFVFRFTDVRVAN